MKTYKSLRLQEKEKYTVPRKVQDFIPVTAIYGDGIFRCGNKFTKSWRFTDINYLTASHEDKEDLFLKYSELLNTLDSGATSKTTYIFDRKKQHFYVDKNTRHQKYLFHLEKKFRK